MGMAFTQCQSEPINQGWRIQALGAVILGAAFVAGLPVVCLAQPYLLDAGNTAGWEASRRDAARWFNDPDIEWEVAGYWDEYIAGLTNPAQRASIIQLHMAKVPGGKISTGILEADLKAYHDQVSPMLKSYGEGWDTYWRVDFQRHIRAGNLVDVKPFWMLKVEVCNQAYREFLLHFQGGLDVAPPRFLNSGEGYYTYHQRFGWRGYNYPDGSAHFPVLGVPCENAVVFCVWLSRETGILHRLPTEAEWIAAFRGTEGRIFPWGNEGPGIDRPLSYQRPMTTGPDDVFNGISGDRSADGVGELFGNAAEIVRGDRPNEFVIRGGSWGHNFATCVPFAERCVIDDPEFIREHGQLSAGFRYVIPLDEHGEFIPYDPRTANND